MILECIPGGPASTIGGISMRLKTARYLTWTLVNADPLLTTVTIGPTARSAGPAPRTVSDSSLTRISRGPGTTRVAINRTRERGFTIGCSLAKTI